MQNPPPRPGRSPTDAPKNDDLRSGDTSAPPALVASRYSVTPTHMALRTGGRQQLRPGDSVTPDPRDRAIASHREPHAADPPAEAFEAHPYQPTNIDAYRSVPNHPPGPGRQDLSTFEDPIRPGAGPLRQILQVLKRPEEAPTRSPAGRENTEHARPGHENKTRF